MKAKPFTIRQEGHCDYCHTKMKPVGPYGIICPKCGPGTDPPKHAPSETQIARTDARCKFCGRNDVTSCRSTIERKDATGKRRPYVVWDARNCPMVKTRRGSKDSIGSGGDSTWYIIPPPHERYERTGIILTDKEVKEKKEDRNMSLDGIDK